jgi:hypothetical protein
MSGLDAMDALASENVGPELEPGIAKMLEGHKALWPGRWPIRAIPDCEFDCPNCPAQLACLIGKRREVGPLVFDREFMCNPRSSVSSLFPLEMFEPMLNKDLQFTRSVHDWPDELRSQFMICTGWDFALSEKVAADFTCKFTIALHRETQRRQILDIKRWKGIQFDRQLHEIQQSHAQFQEDIIILETVLFQQIYKNWITTRTALPVVGHDTGTEKQRLDTGVPSLLLSLEQQKYVIPYASGPTRETVDVWLAECMAFGWVNDKLQGVGEHDDTVIAWWLAELGIKKMGLGTWGAQYVGIDDTVEI